tara:strand:+ start:513 stop:1460 length:948 start_codon:yes stop_codon:yes gene_type:complete
VIASNKLIPTLTLILVFILIFFVISTNYKLNKSDSIILEIPKGSNVSTIADQLYKNNLILSPYLFRIYTRLSFSDEILKAGEYEFTSSESIRTIVNKIVKGNFFYRKLILLPGLTLQNIIDLGASEGLVNDLENKDLLLEEGSFYPDTYFYLKGDSFASILLKSQETWKHLSQKLWEERDTNLPYNNLKEAITLASIIEKEGVEKNKIAGVFVNRLRLGMRLQSDPTVIYALGLKFDGNLRKNDLQIDSPYNTYKNIGLPPGPISIVSEDSLQAALKPLQTDYLYFVSMGNGLHKFSKTLSEHNEAVLKYQINGR